ncbi:M12 family metallopeptidase [Nonlabens xiamenensis]|uniref:M12 family metallopeptidase n=1 Tax=Nonlabens xiamenensis TaxID=2341043 RepID=UPI000F60AFA6|nr:M12 family metallopeptidase [Nonlabens xiamenensis]
MKLPNNLFRSCAVISLVFASCQTEEKFEDEIQQETELQITLLEEQSAFDSSLPRETVTLYGTEIEMIALGNGDFALGDMIFNQDYLDQSNATLGKGVIDRRAGKWPNKTILYRYSNNMPQATKDKVNYAANYITNNTELTVRKWNSNDSAGYVWVGYVEDRGCSAQVGYLNQKFPGQRMNIAPGCSNGSTIHEFLHAAGVIHEQNHHNRDQYVEVLYQNIRDDVEFNYTKLSDANGYEISDVLDLNSIMMYGSYFWQTDAAKQNGWRTMRTVNGGTITPNRSYMTQKDINVINGWY